MFREKIPLDTSLGYVDRLTIAFDNKAKTILIFEDEEEKTFQFILDVAKKMGYKKGVINIIAEQPLKGFVYRYGNEAGANDYIRLIGTTCGYA